MPLYKKCSIYFLVRFCCLEKKTKLVIHFLVRNLIVDYKSVSSHSSVLWPLVVTCWTGFVLFCFVYSRWLCIVYFYENTVFSPRRPNPCRATAAPFGSVGLFELCYFSICFFLCFKISFVALQMCFAVCCRSYARVGFRSAGLDRFCLRVKTFCLVVARVEIQDECCGHFSLPYTRASLWILVTVCHMTLRI